MSNKAPLFSICIPNFNYGDYIGRTIESVLNQTYEDFELIIVDNVSTDNSMKVIKSYAEKDNRIRILENQFNVGFAGNLQKATEPAIGDYIILLSSDDLMYPTALEEYQKIIELNNFADNLIVHSAFDTIDENDAITYVNYRFPKAKPSYSTSDFFHTDIAYTDEQTWEGEIDNTVVVHKGSEAFRASIEDDRSPAAFCATCYSRRLWEQVEGYDLDYHIFPDFSFLLKILASNSQIIYVRSRLFGYRVHGNNQTAQQQRQKVLKKPHDDYVLTYRFSNELLKNTDVTRSEMIKNTVNNKWLYWSIRNYRFISWQEGFRYMTFAWATYPWVAWKLKRNYIALFWTVFGPFHQTVYKLYKR